LEILLRVAAGCCRDFGWSIPMPLRQAVFVTQSRRWDDRRGWQGRWRHMALLSFTMLADERANDPTEQGSKGGGVK